MGIFVEGSHTPSVRETIKERFKIGRIADNIIQIGKSRIRKEMVGNVEL